MELKPMHRRVIALDVHQAKITACAIVVEESNFVTFVTIKVSIGGEQDTQSPANPHAARLFGRSTMNLSLCAGEASAANESVTPARSAHDQSGCVAAAQPWNMRLMASLARLGSGRRCKKRADECA